MSVQRRTRALSLSTISNPVSMRRRVNASLRDLDRCKTITKPSIFADSSKLPPARDNGGRIVFVKQADGSYQGQYSDGSAWNSLLASSTSFDTPTVTFGSTAAAGSSNKTIRKDSVLVFPQALKSTVGSGLEMTLTDDGAGTVVLTSNDTVGLTISSVANLVFAPGNQLTTFSEYTGNLSTPPSDNTFFAVGSPTSQIINYAGNLLVGISLSMAWDDGSTYSSLTHIGEQTACYHDGASSGKFTGAILVGKKMTMQPINAFTTVGNTWSSITGIDLRMNQPSVSGGGTGTVTTQIGIRVDPTEATLGTGAAVTTCEGMRMLQPAAGTSVKRGIRIQSGAALFGTAPTNEEGFYCDAIRHGTTRRASFYSDGMATGTPTNVYAFYQGSAHVVGTNRYGARFTGATTGTPTLAVGVYCDAHSVGTTKWSFYANDESRMNGVQQDDSAKSVYGTGRDAEVYYDGTNLILDPDVVGTGNVRLQGHGQMDDSVKWKLGTGNDAELYYDGTDMILDPDVVGTGSVRHKGKTALEDDTTISDAKNIVLNTSNGTKIGTATNQKLGFWNAAPVAQGSSTGETVGFTAGAGTNVTDASTFTGNVGATAYRISDIVKHLKNAGIVAS